MTKVVLHILISRFFILSCAEPNKPIMVHEYLQGIKASNQNINPQIVFQTLDKVRSLNVSLDDTRY